MENELVFSFALIREKDEIITFLESIGNFMTELLVDFENISEIFSHYNLELCQIIDLKTFLPKLNE